MGLPTNPACRYTELMPKPDLTPESPAHPLAARFALAQTVVREAGALANGYFSRIGTLTIKSKGSHDLVSEADVHTEQLIRERLLTAFPQDAFFGEESGPSGLESAQAADGIWVVDPIDGTQPFLSGLPNWCVSIGFVWQGRIAFGVIYSPPLHELFAGGIGLGATLNGNPIAPHPGQSLSVGLVSVGYSPRASGEFLLHAMRKLLEYKGMFFRNGSGALSLAYVAAGRLIGHFEPHINSWDCVAAIAILEGAGCQVSDFLAPDAMRALHQGNWLVAGPAAVYADLESLLLEKSGLPAK